MKHCLICPYGLIPYLVVRGTADHAGCTLDAGGLNIIWFLGMCAKGTRPIHAHEEGVCKIEFELNF